MLLSSSISSRVTAAASRLLQMNGGVGRRAVGTRYVPTTCRSESQRPISCTPSIQEQITVNVPTMGDSITEGTIVEWCIPPGSLVREGDVLALVETDKVTVDIKADQEGVLVKQLGEVDEEVEVGTGLYIIDTDLSTATLSPSDTDVSDVNASLDAEQIVPVEPEPVPAAPSTTSARVPSIHFLGKLGWKEKLAATDDAPASAAAESSTTIFPTSNSPNSPTSITQMPYSSMFGRPPITDEEMEALILGGADEAPEVKKVVSEDGLSGVVFVGGKVATAGPRGVWLAE